MHESEVKSVARGRDKEEGRRLISVLGGGNSGKDSPSFHWDTLCALRNPFSIFRTGGDHGFIGSMQIREINVISSLDTRASHPP